MFSKALLLPVLSASYVATRPLPVPRVQNHVRAQGAAAAAGDFGSCSVPQIEFGAGFDNRKETSFEPVDKTSFNHGSAQNIDIITKFMCDTLVNSCKADQTAQATCAQAEQAADGATAKTGAQADAFNAVFGIQTNFASVQAIDDQGNAVGGAAAGGNAAAGSAGAANAGAANGASGAASNASGAANKASGAANKASSAANAGASSAAGASSGAASAGQNSAGDAAGASASNNTSAASAAAGNFGSCSTPQIEFGAGFDGRKETSFEPVDKTSFNHGSAQNIDVITQSICDTLVNTCKADQTAQDTCKQAQQAADAQTAKTGAQADAFNAAFGIQTNFASVQAIDDTGKPVAGSADAAAGAGADAASGASASNAGSAASAASSGSASDASGSNAAGSDAAGSNAAGSGAAGNGTAAASAGSAAGDFGSCSTPQIEFGAGFDNRKETSFEPVDKTSFNHGSAQNIDIITQFMCDTLVNSCKADETAQATCKQAQQAADGATAKTGAQADAFNAVFGIQTNFASVQAIDDQGNAVGGAAAGAAAGNANGAKAAKAGNASAAKNAGGAAN